jgi:hypothetical protein
MGFEPDHVFTHVTRFVPSKGLWRDIGVMERLAPLLEAQGRSAVLFVLSTVIPVGRAPRAILEMEARYGWPVYHQETPIDLEGRAFPDLVSHEIAFYDAIQRFNRVAPTCKIVLVNQFGWSRDRCGKRMPHDMSFVDLRRGSDLEFGQSIYEPFGIAQVEPLSYGALCVISNVCGCLGFLRQVGGLTGHNAIVANYTQASDLGSSIKTAMAIDQARRDEIEAQQAHVVALKIAERLPRDASVAQEILERGYGLSQKMSWEVVAADYLLPGLAKTRRD